MMKNLASITKDLVKNFEFKVLKSVLEIGLIKVCEKVLWILVSHIDKDIEVNEGMRDFIYSNNENGSTGSLPKALY